MNRDIAILLAITLVPAFLVLAALGAISGIDLVTPTVMIIVFTVFILGALFEIRRLVDQP